MIRVTTTVGLYRMSLRQFQALRALREAADRFEYWISPDRVDGTIVACSVDLGELTLNAYLAEDGQHKWFEVMLADTSRPEVSGDMERKWIKGQRGRAFRGKTPAGRKSRGLTRKGVGAEKTRPSVRAGGK